MTRVALVTGGNRGIGRAIAVGLAEDGCDVVVNYRRDADAAAETVAAIEALGRKAVAVQAPVDDAGACASLAQQTIETFGGIDVLVTNAGIASRGKSSVDTEREEIERHLSTHALSAFELCRHLLGSMRERGGGHVIGVSSAATLHWAGWSAPYNMGKAALEAFLFGLAKEVRKHNIHVHVVAPGLVDTEMGRRLVKASAGVQDIRTLDAMSPFGRVCTPDDVADVVRYLCSPAAGYLTGQKIVVDGGQTAAG
jgi:3-oxoacyl-[acyl-carrier protein] reductase